MTFRTIKPRLTDKHVENDLRDLGSYVAERPPYYELLCSVAPKDVETHKVVKSLEEKHGFREHRHKEYYRAIVPGQMPFHQNAIWCFFFGLDIATHLSNVAVVLRKVVPL